MQKSRIEPTTTEPAVIAAPEIFRQLSSIQNQALDLYARGLNVFPAPRPEEVRRWAATTKNDPEAKPVYLLKPLFYARLHVCGPDCRRRYNETGRRCVAEAAEFINLFERANLAVMLGRTSGNLFELEADNPRTFDRLGATLQERGIPFWALTSSRGGAFLMRLVEGEAENAPTVEGWPDLQIWGNQHYQLLPPSIHRTGIVYQWVGDSPRASLLPGEPPPAVNLADLAFLGVKLNRRRGKKAELYGLPEWTIVLSERNRAILSTKIPAGIRNIKLTRAVYDMAAAMDRGACSWQDITALLLDFCRRTEYPYSHALQMMQSAEKKRDLTGAREYHGNQHTETAADRAAKFAAAFDWRICERTATTDRAVFLACIERARLDNSDTFRAAIREIALMANITKKTALQALRRLARPTRARPALLIRQEADSARIEATRYQFSPDCQPSGGSVGVYPIISTCLISGVITDTQKQDITALHDIFYRRKAAGRVYDFLLAGGSGKASQLARALKMARTTVIDSLQWLTKNGLAVYNRADGMYYGEAKTTAELETIAAKLYTLGKAEAREREYLRDRETRNNDKMRKARQYWRRSYPDMVE